jgi:ketosteroid isomerase-like protein
LESRPADKDTKDVEALIRAFYDAGRSKELTDLAGFHGPRDQFTKFDENPPYTRQNSEEAFIYEQAAFANISDYNYSIEDLRIDLFGDVAIATFYLSYSGMFVNDYSFEGSPVRAKTRVTMALARTQKGWKLVHEHLSRMPDQPTQARPKTSG